MLYKTIDELLNENDNLHNAVTILIMGLMLTTGNGEYLAEWDKLRQADSKHHDHKLCKDDNVLTVIQDALLKAIGNDDSELINVLSSAYQRIATSQI